MALTVVGVAGRSPRQRTTAFRIRRAALSRSFYFAGHGVQVSGENFLIALDFCGLSAAES